MYYLSMIALDDSELTKLKGIVPRFHDELWQGGGVYERLIRAEKR
ncbi:hypothetical protein [Nostoc sp. PCC 7120 = FACHB-418]|nr:hypothetical protein [Nostoc sp. PCC 7120 = FACHB-418]